MKANKNLIIILAATAILLSTWVYYLSQKNQMVQRSTVGQFPEVSQQSSSDEPAAIESDLIKTSFDDVDSDVLGIQTELNSTTEVETK